MNTIPVEAISKCEEEIKVIQEKIESMRNFRNAGSIGEQWKTLSSSPAAYTDFMETFAKEIFPMAEIRIRSDYIQLIACNYSIEIPIKCAQNKIYARYLYGRMRKIPELPYVKEINDYRNYASLLQKSTYEAAKMLFPNRNWFVRLMWFKKFCSRHPEYKNAQHWIDKANELEKDAQHIYEENLAHYNKYQKDRAKFMDEFYPIISEFAGTTFTINVE